MARLRHRKLLSGIVIGLLLVGVGLVIAQDQETLRIKTTIAAEDPAFPSYLARLLGHPLTEGDSYVVHTNGSQAFPAMLGAIEGAQSRISLETYIFAPDQAGQRFHEALLRAAKRGVNVRLLERLDHPGLHLRGAVVDHIEGAFNENWIETIGLAEPQVQSGEPAPQGGGRSIVVRSSSEGGTNELKLLYLLAIAAARRTLDIESPYVITDESAQWSLADARSRGVRIRILMEGDITDAKPVKFAGRADYGKLLDLGIELYEYQPAMMHTKAIVVDGILSIVGSANFDNRSLELNDELNVVAFDRGLAVRLTEDFERDMTRSTRIRLEDWRARPLHIRARDEMWNLFGEVF